MPTAHIRDIETEPQDEESRKALKDPSRRVTGTADIPLTARGKEQGADLAKRCKGFFEYVYSSPMERALTTAKLIDPDAIAKTALGPFKLAEHEGKPVETERGKINERIKNRPDETAPGVSSHSGEKGESFEEYADRGLSLTQRQLAFLKKHPDDAILNVTHGRNMRLNESWALAGFPQDRSVDIDEMTRDGDDWSEPGSLFMMTDAGLKQVIDKPKLKGRVYFARHGETEFSQGEPTEEKAKIQPGQPVDGKPEEPKPQAAPKGAAA